MDSPAEIRSVHRLILYAVSVMLVIAIAAAITVGIETALAFAIIAIVFPAMILVILAIPIMLLAMVAAFGHAKKHPGEARDRMRELRKDYTKKTIRMVLDILALIASYYFIYKAIDNWTGTIFIGSLIYLVFRGVYLNLFIKTFSFGYGAFHTARRGEHVVDQIASILIMVISLVFMGIVLAFILALYGTLT